MALNREDELKIFFTRKDLLLRCHYWNPLAEMCSCKNPECATPGKHPIELRGVWDARAYGSAREIGNFNVALACGQGLMGLDIDPRNGGDKTLERLEKQHGKLPPTWSAFTGGGGYHHFFSAPVGTRTNHKLSKQGIELQGYGSYLVLPTSVHKTGREYEWDKSPTEVELAPLPDWLLTIGMTEEEKTGEAADGLLRDYTYADIEDILSFIGSDCERVTWRNIGWALRDCGVPFEMFDAWSSKSSKYVSSKDCYTVWRGYNSSKGIHAGTLFGIAKDRGWERKDQAINDDAMYDHLFSSPPEPEPLPPPIEEQDPSQHPDPVFDLDNFDSVGSCPDFPPGLLGDLARNILESSPVHHKQFSIATALYVVSALATMNYVTPIKNGILSSIMVLTAPAGAGKEHYRAVAEKIIRKIAVEKETREPKSSQALRFDWQECNSLSFVNDEILKWFSLIYDPRNPNGRQIVSDILSVWGLNSDILKGYSTKRREDSTPDVFMPALCIYGCGTEQKFDELISVKDFSHDGLLSRMDVVFTKHSLDKHHTPLDSVDFTLKKKIVNILIKIAKKPVEVEGPIGYPSQDEFKKKPHDRNVVIKFYNRYMEREKIKFNNTDTEDEYRRIFAICKENQFKSYGDSIEESLWSRSSEKVVRVACYLALMDNPDNPKVTVDHFKWAWKWQRYVIEGVRKQIGVNKGSPHENLRRRIVEATRKLISKKPDTQQTVTLSELVQFDWDIRQASHRERMDAIEALITSNEIDKVADKRKTTVRIRLIPQ